MDRLGEAHWHIHQMELYYHFADPFRFSLSSFLRALKEIPDIVAMEVQHVQAASARWRESRGILIEDPLLKRLSKWRDVVVHKAMIAPLSSATVGFGDTRGIKAGLGRPVDPRRDSDVEMAIAAKVANPSLDVFRILTEDDDSIPCVERDWRLSDLPDENVLVLASRAWTRMADAVASLERGPRACDRRRRRGRSSGLPQT